MAQHKKSGNKPYNKNRNNDNRNRNNNRNDNRSRDDNRNRNNRNDNRNRNDHRQGQQQDSQKQDNAPKKETQSKTESSNDLIIFIVFLIALAAFFLVNKFYLAPKKNSLYGTTNQKFMKEGTLTFLDAQSEKVIIGIDIEIAKSTYEIEKGLMNRGSLPLNGGMLFIYDNEHYRSFWMKDTYLSLDIIFLNAEKEIIRICKKAKPLSHASIPSGGKAMYVVEVLAEFTDAYNIRVGDHIEFTQ